MVRFGHESPVTGVVVDWSSRNLHFFRAFLPVDYSSVRNDFIVVHCCKKTYQNADGISATSVVMASPACLSCRWEGQDLEFELLAAPPPPEQDEREAMQLLQWVVVPWPAAAETERTCKISNSHRYSLVPGTEYQVLPVRYARTVLSVTQESENYAFWLYSSPANWRLK